MFPPVRATILPLMATGLLAAACFQPQEYTDDRGPIRRDCEPNALGPVDATTSAESEQAIQRVEPLIDLDLVKPTPRNVQCAASSDSPQVCPSVAYCGVTFDVGIPDDNSDANGYAGVEFRLVNVSVVDATVFRILLDNDCATLRVGGQRVENNDYAETFTLAKLSAASETKEGVQIELLRDTTQIELPCDTELLIASDGFQGPGGSGELWTLIRWE